MATFSSYPALGARNFAALDSGRDVQRNAQMINMMAQQQAAQRQSQAAQQTMDINAAQEARAARLAEPQFAKADAEAKAAFIKTGLDFSNFIRVAVPRASTPEQASIIAQRIGGLPQFQDPIFQNALGEMMQEMPADPGKFPAWQDRVRAETLAVDNYLKQHFMELTSGGQTWTASTPEFRGTGGGTMEIPGTRQNAPQGITYVKTDKGIIAMPKEISGGAPGTGGGYDVVYGDGKYGSPPAALTGMTIGDVQKFQTGTLIPATRGKVGAGPDKGTGAVGRYQITYDTLRRYAPKVLGTNWQSTAFTPEVQDRLGEAIYNDVKNGDLNAIWKGMPKNKPGEYSNVPWDQVKDKIASVESRGRGTGVQFGDVVAGVGGKKPSTESERRFGTIAKQMGTNLGEMVDVLNNTPSAIQPSTGEYLASQLPVYGEEAALFAQSEPRQQFVSAALRFLDNITYVNTGAGTSKTQEENYRRSYIPTYQDTRASAYRKLSNMISFAENVKDAAGVLWTPQMDAQLTALRGAVDRLKPAPKQAPGGGRASSSKSSLPPDVASKYGL